MDTNRQAICAYQVVNNEFRLISSRSYAFDIQLEDSEQVKKRGGYPAGGTYRGVKDWVESARATPATRGGRRGAGGTVP